MLCWVAFVHVFSSRTSAFVGSLGSRSAAVNTYVEGWDETLTCGELEGEEAQTRRSGDRDGAEIIHETRWQDEPPGVTPAWAATQYRGGEGWPRGAWGPPYDLARGRGPSRSHV